MKKQLTLLALLSSTVVFAQEDTLKANAQYTQYSRATSIKSADINGDGLNDVVISSDHYTGVSIYLNQGGMKFILDAKFNQQQFAGGFSIKDFDSDGDFDIWVTEGFGENDSAQNSIYLNDGAGSFDKTLISMKENYTQRDAQVHSGDFDGNGTEDVLVVYDQYLGSADLFINNGSGQFSQKETGFSDVYEVALNVELGDFDGDGDLDIWSANDWVTVYLNNGAAGFDVENSVSGLASTPNQGRFVLKDINKDGLIDFQTFSTQYMLPRYINKGNGEFESEGVAGYFGYPGIQNGVFLDVDSDGDLDLWYTHELDLRSRVIKTSASGAVDYSSDEIYFDDSQVFHSVASDFDGDGDEDVISVGYHGLSVWNQLAPEHFEKVNQADINGKWGVFRNTALLDMNNDGNKDLILVGDSGIKVAEGRGRTGFGPLQSWTEHVVSAFHATDFNKDGWGDLVVIDKSKGAYLLINDKNNSFEQVELELPGQLDWSDPFSNNTIPADPFKVKAFDLNEDGNEEIVIQEFYGRIFVLSKSGSDYTYGVAQTIQGEFRAFGLGDLNGDGEVELVTNSPLGFGDGFKGVSVYSYQNGFTITADYQGSFYLPNILIGDLNNDQSNDVLLSNTSSVYKYLNFDGQSLVQYEMPAPTPGYPQYAADFNMDQKVDFITEKGQILISNGSNYVEQGAAENQSVNTSIETFVSDLESDGDLDLVLFEQVAGITTFVNTTIDQDFSGLWFNSAQAGHGLQVEEVISNGVPQVNLAWYVYDQGQPMWVTGVGPIDGNSATIPLAITTGASFGSAFNSSDVELAPWGSMTLTFTDKHKLNMAWDGSEYGFSQGEMPLDRLSVLSGNVKNQTGIKTCHTGSWYNPTQSGHGFLVQVIAGEVDRMILTWFTYHNGEQYWMIADGNIEGDTVVMNAYSASGPNFPPEYNTQDYSPELWGQITFKIKGDESATVSWQPELTGFEAGSLAVNKLTYIDRYRCN